MGEAPALHLANSQTGILFASRERSALALERMAKPWFKRAHVHINNTDLLREMEKKREGEGTSHESESKRGEERRWGKKDKERRAFLCKISAGSGCHHIHTSFQRFTLSINLLFSSK